MEEVLLIVTRFLRSVGRFLGSIPGVVLAILDWLVQVAERLIVLALTCLLFWYGYLVLCGRTTAQASNVIVEIAKDWKAVILILIPLFYRTTRIFLEQVESAFGMKRSPHPSDEEEEQPESPDEE